MLSANETAEAEALVQEVIEQGLLLAEQEAAAFGDGTYTGVRSRGWVEAGACMPLPPHAKAPAPAAR